MARESVHAERQERSDEIKTPRNQGHSLSSSSAHEELDVQHSPAFACAESQAFENRDIRKAPGLGTRHRLPDFQGGDFTPAFLKYFKNGSEKPVFISFSLHFTIVDYYPPSFHFILTMRVFGENGFFWINWKGRVKSLGKVSNRATYLS